MRFLQEMAGIQPIKGCLRVLTRPFATPICIKHFVAKTPDEVDRTIPRSQCLEIFCLNLGIPPFRIVEG